MCLAGRTCTLLDACLQVGQYAARSACSLQLGSACSCFGQQGLPHLRLQGSQGSSSKGCWQVYVCLIHVKDGSNELFSCGNNEQAGAGAQLQTLPAGVLSCPGQA